MKTPLHLTTPARAILTGAVMLALAACQPVVSGPGTGTGSETTTTTTAPTFVTTTTTQPSGAAQPAPTPTTTAPPAPAPAPAPTGWRLVGGDEFDGTTVDTSKWRVYHNTYGDGNNELACLTPNNVRQSGGTLKITSKKEAITCPGNKARSYSSGFLGTREIGVFYPRYARFEIRAKVPHAQGLWPAFWLRHRNGASVAEIDIMEYFHSQVPGKTTQTLHLDGRYNISKKTTSFEAPTLSPGFHTWAVEIQPDTNGVRFTFFMDGVQTHTFVDTQHHWASADPNATWDIAINQAVGGKWVGSPDDALGYLRDLNRCSIGGTAPSGCTSTGIRRVDWNHSTYEVDYVRVFTKS